MFRAASDSVRWIASFFVRQTLVRRSSLHHAHLEVVQLRGRKVLDGATVNYSFGGLHEVFAEVFERLDVRRRDVKSVLVLGLGAGSVVHLLRRDCAIAAPITAIEIDAAVIELGKLHFGLGEWRDLEIVQADARAWVESSTRSFDLVVVDVFDEARIPDALKTNEFLVRLRAAVAPGGLLVFNQVSSRPEVRLESHRFAAQCAQVFAGSRTLEVGGNLVIVFEAPRA
jgi:spermidine synthase